MRDYQRNKREKQKTFRRTGHIIIKNSIRANQRTSSMKLRVLAKHHGFTDAKLDFIIDYDKRYRMGDALFENHEAGKGGR